MEGGAMDESRVRKRQRVGLFPACDELDFSVACPFSDVKLVSASGAVLYGSRYTLAVRSPVCKKMLLGGMREAQFMAVSDVVTIPFPGMRTEALQVLLEFCTSGSFSENRVQEAPVDVIFAARYFQLTDNMEDLIGSMTKEMGVGSKLDGRLAETLSLALECLPTDLEACFFELLVKKIFSRPIFDLPYSKLSPRALEFLLSTTLQCSEPWASGFPFCSNEFLIFRYLLQWSGHQVSEDAQQRLENLYGEEQATEDDEATEDYEPFDIDECAPGTVEALESAATIAQPFLPFVDFRLIYPEQIAVDILPLNVVPDKMLLAAFAHHAKTDVKETLVFRGPYVLQWDDDARGFGLDIEAENRRVLFCHKDTTGFARAYSRLKGGGEHSWIATVSTSSNNLGGIGIGFCFGSEKQYSNWLGHSSGGWILDGSGRLWQNGKPSTVKSGLAFGFTVTKVQVTVNLDTANCRFTVTEAGQQGTQAGQQGIFLEFKVPELLNRRKIYPAASFNKAWGEVSLCPVPV